MKTYDTENLKIAVENFRKAMIKFAEWIKNTVAKIWKALDNFCGIQYNKVGYRRKAKAKQIAYYQSISAGKSNNWRRNHGLPLARSKC